MITEEEIFNLIIDATNAGETPATIVLKDARDAYEMSRHAMWLSKGDGKYYYNPCGADLLIQCDPNVEEKVSLK